jgi:hypothetical protein
MFSLRTLLIAIAVAALGIAAIVNRTPLWASAFVTLTVALILAATVLAILRPCQRAFWMPVAIVGLGYTGIIYIDLLQDLHHLLVTTRLTAAGWRWLHRDAIESTADARSVPQPDDPFADPTPGEYTGAEVVRDARRWHNYNEEHAAKLRSYYWSAQSLWTLMLAFGSGLVSWHFLRPRPGAISHAASTPQSPSSPA